MENKNKKILVYGSLRKGEYNYKRFKSMFKDGLKYIETLNIQGFRLYDLGSYPGIKETPTDTTLVVDVMECDPACYASIYGMEIGANYVAKNIVINNEDHTIYVYQGSTHKLVESGDWSKYLSHEQLIEA